MKLLATTALASAASAALAVHEEAQRLLTLLGETSGRHGAGAFSPVEIDALNAWASSVEPTLAMTATALSETRARLRRAAGLRRPAHVVDTSILPSPT